MVAKRVDLIKKGPCRGTTKAMNTKLAPGIPWTDYLKKAFNKKDRNPLTKKDRKTGGKTKREKLAARHNKSVASVLSGTYWNHLEPIDTHTNPIVYSCNRQSRVHPCKLIYNFSTGKQKTTITMHRPRGGSIESEKRFWGTLKLP